MIEVDNLTKFYGQREAIKALHFSVGEGEIVGFLGPNGAGKTTTMRVLAGYMPPTSGNARVAGFDVVEESMEVRKRIGYLPESIPLYDEMSVSQYLRFMGTLRKVSKLEKKIRSVLDRVGLRDRADSYIGSLSKGLRQRVGLAQAILHDPPILILDEPTIGLDPEQIKAARTLLAELGQDHTVILSTHILSEAEQLCDRVLIIDQGRIVAQDSPANLRRQLGSSSLIIVRANLSTKKLTALLKDIKALQHIEPLAGQEGAVEVRSASETDIRPILARKIVEAGADLLELRPLDLSLEEVYLKLIRPEVIEP